MLFIKKYFQTILAASAGFIMPIYSLFLATGFLVIMDLISGIYAARKRGEIFSSKKLGKTVTKMIWYYMAILLGYVMQVEFIDDIPVAKITAGIIASVEFTSNLENIHWITGIDFTRVIRDFINKDRGL